MITFVTSVSPGGGVASILKMTGGGGGGGGDVNVGNSYQSHK